MEEISKKELLEQTGISYGQLYRWKRERLIPEEWFVKRSAITGQETYFPKTQILDRVQTIVELKGDHSLEEIRDELADEKRMVLLRELKPDEVLCLLCGDGEKYYLAVTDESDAPPPDEDMVVLRAETLEDRRVLAAVKKKQEKSKKASRTTAIAKVKTDEAKGKTQ